MKKQKQFLKLKAIANIKVQKHNDVGGHLHWFKCYQKHSLYSDFQVLF